MHPNNRVFIHLCGQNNEEVKYFRHNLIVILLVILQREVAYLDVVVKQYLTVLDKVFGYY